MISYQDVSSHNTPDSAHVAYDGMVYDVTDFIAQHPGGRDILVPALGTDITDVFNTIHKEYVRRFFRSDSILKRYGIRVVGRLEAQPGEKYKIGRNDYQSRRSYSKEDPLWDDLKSAVGSFLRKNHLSTTKSHTECLLLLAFFYSLYAIAMYRAFIEGSVIWCLLLGPIATFMAVNAAHTAMHGGFSDSKTLNKAASLLMDAGGYSAFGWTIEHLNHHETPHSTIDVQTNLDSIVRFYGHQEYKWYHKYQMYYLWFVLLLYTPSQFVGHTYGVLFKYNCLNWADRALHLAVKLVFFVLPITASFFILPPSTALFNFFLFVLSTSYASILLLFIQHEDSYIAEEENEPWAVRQVLTASSWRTHNRAVEWLLGYFNYHTEHHLFPALNPSLYPRIQPIVKEICRRHGVRYNHISYFQLVRSQIAAWRKFSQEAQSHVVTSPA